MRWIQLFFLSFVSVSVRAQESKVYRVSAGEEITSGLQFTDFHRYPSFKAGNVYFLDGRNSPGMLNYNLLLDEMQFLSGKDTLSLADEATIDYIAIDKDTFYYHDKGYLRLLSSAKNMKLAIKEVLRVSSIESKGSYGLPVSTGAVDNYTSIKNDKLTVNQDILLMVQSSFWIGERKDFYPANKKNAERLFSKSHKNISTYLRNINYEDREQLQTLFQYLYILK